MNKIFRVDNRIVQEADDLSKETRIDFRDCLDILVRAYLADDVAKRPKRETPVSV